jgi:hypothetical protein
MVSEVLEISGASRVPSDGRRDIAFDRILSEKACVDSVSCVGYPGVCEGWICE